MLKNRNNFLSLKFLKKIYRKYFFKEYLPIDTPKYFLNNSQNRKIVCFILAGYKEFTWDIVFKRIQHFCPDNIDICILSSGKFDSTLNNIATKNNWSYIATKINNVCQTLNIGITCFDKAQYIFKIDEDIFITQDFFNNLINTYKIAEKDYKIGFVAPLIPINGYGYRRILENINLVDFYSKKFEYPKISAGPDMKIESDLDVAKFMWSYDNIIPQIDDLNKLIKNTYSNTKYSTCPIRFSIGAILFSKDLIKNFGLFPTRLGNGMGQDEVHICNLATKSSMAIIISETQVVGHLSFGKQNQGMKEYFISHKNIFDIKE